MYSLLKKIYYKLLEIVTFGKGVNVTINGFALKLPTKYYRLFPSDYEKDGFAFVRKCLPKDANVIDIGAHIGIYSVFFSKNTTGKVFSFEPTIETIEVLANTLKNNHCDNVQLVKGAIADKPGKAVFYTSKTEEIATGNSLVEVETNENYIREGAYEVDVYSIDDFAKKQNVKIGFIKIDAEGVELDVLNGAEMTFKNDRPSAILGLHPFAYKSRDTLYTMWDKLIEYGMSVQVEGKEMFKDDFCKNPAATFDVELIPIEKISKV